MCITKHPGSSPPQGARPSFGDGVCVTRAPVVRSTRAKGWSSTSGDLVATTFVREAEFLLEEASVVEYRVSAAFARVTKQSTSTVWVTEDARARVGSANILRARREVRTARRDNDNNST